MKFDFIKSDGKTNTVYWFPVLGYLQTHYDPKPIPTNLYDWSAITDDYEPGHPIGYGPTEDAAVKDLLAEIEWRKE